jgi:hypothetical protein
MVLLVGIYFFESGWAYKESFFTDLPAPTCLRVAAPAEAGASAGRRSFILPNSRSRRPHLERLEKNSCFRSSLPD